MTVSMSGLFVVFVAVLVLWLYGTNNGPAKEALDGVSNQDHGGILPTFCMNQTEPVSHHSYRQLEYLAANVFHFKLDGISIMKPTDPIEGRIIVGTTPQEQQIFIPFILEVHWKVKTLFLFDTSFHGISLSANTLAALGMPRSGFRPNTVLSFHGTKLAGADILKPAPGQVYNTVGLSFLSDEHRKSTLLINTWDKTVTVRISELNSHISRARRCQEGATGVAEDGVQSCKQKQEKKEERADRLEKECGGIHSCVYA